MGLFLSVFLFLAIVLTIFKLYNKLTTGWCRSNVCLLGKTVIVTGANSGIGYEAALDFGKRGAKVILACRDTTRGQEAQKKIIEATNNPNIVFKLLDVSSFKSVRAFAEDINANEERIDILVNNAGVGGLGKKKTEEGLLKLMQVNYFGPFLLTNLLLNLIKKTPNSRIVNVSSLAAKYHVNFDVSKLNEYPEDRPRPNVALYARSKLCNILFTMELANRLRGTSVTCYSLHPGVVLTAIFDSMPPFMKAATKNIIGWFFKSSLEGAQTTIYCSVEKGIASLSGEHFADCQISSRYKTAQDPELPGKLWKATENLIKNKAK